MHSAVALFSPHRLSSATTCSDASEKLNGKYSVVFSRDLIAMVWFTIGTLRELATALKDLRSALQKRELRRPGQRSVGHSS